MAAFEYHALTASPGGVQRSQRGVIEADTPRQARALLRERGLIPLDVQAVTARRAPWRLHTPISARERALVLRQLATLLSAGLPLEEALAVLVEQASAATVRRPLASIRSRVMEGQSLSASMLEHPQLFTRLYTASVAAAERAGQLQVVLARLADHAEQQHTARRGLGVALVYPVLLAVIAVAVVTGLIGLVVPRVVVVFEQSAQTLPWITRSLMALADGVSRYGLWVVVLGVIAMVVGLRLVRHAPIRHRLDGGLLRLPWLGGLLAASETAVMTRTLAILIDSAVPLVEALSVTATVSSNQIISADLRDAASQVREGRSLTQSLSGASWLPAVARRLIQSGERSGELSSMLEHAAHIQNQSVTATTAVVLAVLQPALILIVGLAVLYIVLAIMLPILNMSQLLGGP
jgi:general secretion pathway protein F